MAVDLHAQDPVFRGGKRPGEHVDELISFAQQRLGGVWSPVSSRMKLRKTLFEAEVDGRRVIGKTSASKRAHTAFDSLTKLWNAGMRPPSRYTVPEPLGWFPERDLLLQDKAPGLSVLDAMQKGRKPIEYVSAAASWLKVLWTLEVDAADDVFDPASVLQPVQQLFEATGDDRIPRIAASCAQVLSAGPAVSVPSHGDFHPMNIFVSPDRVTAIDLDTFSRRDPEMDVAYFLAQIANLGLHVFATGDFARTHAMRRLFLEECGPLDDARIAAHMAWTLVRSLHYDLCILHVENEHADLMVRSAERLLADRSPDALS